MILERTPEGKVVLYRTSDGQRFVRWPIDARDMLASGEYTAVPPNSSGEDASWPASATVGTSQEHAARDVQVTTAAQFFADQRANDVRPVVDPMPHVAEALALSAAQSPTGAPLVVAPNDGPPPVARPVQLPGAHGSAARRRR